MNKLSKLLAILFAALVLSVVCSCESDEPTVNVNKEYVPADPINSATSDSTWVNTGGYREL